MKNVSVEVKDDKLILTIDLTQSFGPSVSGKTIIVASSEGTNAVPGHEGVAFGLNVYKKKER